MKNLIKIAALSLGMIAAILTILVFGRTEALLMMPQTTPEAFLAGMPYRDISLLGDELVLIQPGSTFLGISTRNSYRGNWNLLPGNQEY